MDDLLLDFIYSDLVFVKEKKISSRTASTTASSYHHHFSYYYHYYHYYYYYHYYHYSHTHNEQESLVSPSSFYISCAVVFFSHAFDGTTGENHPHPIEVSISARRFLENSKYMSWTIHHLFKPTTTPY